MQKANSYDILNHYLDPYHRYGKIMQGQHISNPFIFPQKQETPSFNIYCTGLRDHQWRYKDFATGDDGSCFDLVMNLFNLDFPDALLRICKDFNLQAIEPPAFMSQSTGCYTEIIIDANTRIFTKPFEAHELKYWGAYRIQPEHLDKFKVNAVDKYASISKANKPYEIRSRVASPIFSYTLSPEAIKIYKPLEKKYRFQYLGKKPKEYVFGYDVLPEFGETVLLTGGEKDVICLHALGYSAVSLNSETALPSQSLIQDLKSRFDKVAILYDADETGTRQAQKIHERFALPIIQLPNIQSK